MRKTIAAMFGVLMAATVGVGLHSQAAVPWQLIEHTIATDLRGGYHVVAADINKDSRIDLLAVSFRPTADVVWFENPSWTRHVMAAGVEQPINADAYDIDGDGYPEIALQSGFGTTPAKSAGVMTLLSKGADINGPWNAREFDRTPAAHRVRWIDAEGNGRKLLINAPLGGVKGAPPDYRDSASIYAYDARDLKRQIVTDADEGVIHGLHVVDWDGKGREALLSASFLGIHLHRYNNGKWLRTRLTPGNPEPWPKNGSSDVAVLRTKGGRQLAAIEPWHGNQVVIYRGKGDTWDNRTVIDDTITDGHTLVSADLDGDGVDEVIAGYRGAGGGVNVYRLENDRWTKSVLSQKSVAAGCAVADLNNDKRPDVACLGSPDLKWYENQPAK
jgi:hypothetical protein